MSYRSALVDRGRRVYRTRGTRDVNTGESLMVTTHGHWLPMRLNPPDSNKSRSETGATHENLEADLMLPREAVKYELDDRVEIDSVELGRATWLLTQRPQPIRKRRVVIGYLVRVRQVDDL